MAKKNQPKRREKGQNCLAKANTLTVRNTRLTVKNPVSSRENPTHSSTKNRRDIELGIYAWAYSLTKPMISARKGQECTGKEIVGGEGLLGSHPAAQNCSIQ